MDFLCDLYVGVYAIRENEIWNACDMRRFGEGTADQKNTKVDTLIT